MAGQTLIYARGNTREGMFWAFIDDFNNLPLNLSGATMDFVVYDPLTSDVIISESGEVLLPPGAGQVRYVVQPGDMETLGNFNVDVKLVFGDDTVGFVREMTIVITKTGFDLT